MIEVPESHITFGVYNSTLGIGVAKSEPFPVWAIIAIAAACVLVIAMAIYFLTRAGKTGAVSGSTKAIV